MTLAAADEVIRVGQIEIRFRLQAAQTGGSLTMFEGVVPVAARVPIAHSHEAFDETVFGLEGVTVWTLDGDKTTVRPGEVLFIPRGRVHHFENLGVEAARLLNIVTPGLLGPEYFREMADVLDVHGPPAVERILEVMRRHGIRPAVRPPS